MTTPRLPSMSPTESLVMELLRGRERYGLELVDASGRRAQARLRLRDARPHGREGVCRLPAGGARAGHQRAAAPPLSRHSLRAEGPRRVRDCCATRWPSSRRRRNELRVPGHRVCRSLPVGAHVRSDRRAGAGRPAVRRGLRAGAAGSPAALRCSGGRRRRSATMSGATPAAAQADAAVGVLTTCFRIAVGCPSTSRPGPSSSSRRR